MAGGQPTHCQGPQTPGQVIWGGVGLSRVPLGVVERRWLPGNTKPLLAPKGRLRLEHVCSKKQRRMGLGRYGSGIPGEVELRSGVIQELEESLAWNKLEPWRVSPPGEVTGREAAEEIGVGDKHLRNGVWDSV